MSKFSFSVPSFTPVVVADTTGMTAGGFAALQTGTSDTSASTQVQEIFQQGLAAASAVNQMVWARDTTIALTPTALSTPNSNGPLNPNARPAAANQIVVGLVNASTLPQRATTATLARLSLAFNAFGGINRWQAAPGEEWWIFGTAQPNAESSLSAFTGSPGLEGVSIIYEPL